MDCITESFFVVFVFGLALDTPAEVFRWVGWAPYLEFEEVWTAGSDMDPFAFVAAAGTRGTVDGLSVSVWCSIGVSLFL